MPEHPVEMGCRDNRLNVTSFASPEGWLAPVQAGNLNSRVQQKYRCANAERGQATLPDCEGAGASASVRLGVDIPIQSVNEPLAVVERGHLAGDPLLHFHLP